MLMVALTLPTADRWALNRRIYCRGLTFQNVKMPTCVLSSDTGQLLGITKAAIAMPLIRAAYGVGS